MAVSRILSCLLLFSLSPLHQSLPYYGCNLSDSLCDDSEICFEDGLFGQCYNPQGNMPVPTVLDDLDDLQLEVLKLELTRLADQGQEWADTRAQCVLSYFKLSMAYQLQYDPDFCQVREPSNIWALVQLIEMGLKEDPTAITDNAPELDNNLEEVLVPVVLDEEKEAREDTEAEMSEVAREAARDVDELSDRQVKDILKELYEEPVPVIEADAVATLEMPELSDSDSSVVSSYLQDIVNDKKPDLSLLSDEQLNALIGGILELKQEYENAQVSNATEPVVGEVVEPIAVDESQMQNVLKKDVEKVGDVRTGLNPDVHNIVKGRRSEVSRVVGNRIYLKVNIKNEEQLLPLIEFLQNTIATPNKLVFDDFTFDDGQLSLRISRMSPSTVEEAIEESMKEAKEEEDVAKGKEAAKDPRVLTPEGIAKAVYKRRKDIAQFSGAEVAETGIGIGDESLPVANNEQDWLFLPLLFISVFTITSLIGVLAVHMYKRRKGSNYAANIRQLADTVDGKSDKAYQELCRERMSQEGTVGALHSKSSSTSSWVEDEKGGIDISTGHVLLNFLQTSLSDPMRIDSQWETIKDYRDNTKTTTIAEAHSTDNKAVLPYNETLVAIAPSSNEASTSADEYLNASLVYDDDPKQAVFIAAQSPLPTQFATFWRSVWQQGVNLIVNLSTLEESRGEAYWPEKGSECHGEFEIHLVSEHIWSDDYLVRSFYLKNIKDGQTRTITQFHYVSWKANDAPSTPKSLLEFRRKVNKSYRGRCSPLLVHSTEGAGRTGVYCAVDIICQRIQHGVKEIDVAASLEHLRDQRPCMVKTASQYKFIYACVAQEVDTLLKGLQQ